MTTITDKEIAPQVLQRTMPHSLEVSMNAKGEHSYSAKTYFDLDQLEEAERTLQSIDTWFCGLYRAIDIDAIEKGDK